jgi:peptidoglycan/xylan/chitin deacetylase (PgdA/CDA1 family)
MTAVPILMYHQVMREAPAGMRKYAVTPRAFAAQMRWLAAAGYTPIDLGTLLAHRAGQCGLPRAPIVITFDDGYRGCLEHAVPVLVAFGFRATFFLVAGLVGGTSRWLRQERGIELPLLDWSAARALQAAGFTCGAHSLTHPRLAELSAEAARRELQASRELLEERLGCAVEDLAYPFGSYDDETRALAAEAGYRSACSVRIGLSGPGDDPLALHRVPVSGEETLPDFVCRLHTARSIAELARRKRGAATRWLRRWTHHA